MATFRKGRGSSEPPEPPPGYTHEHDDKLIMQSGHYVVSRKGLMMELKAEIVDTSRAAVGKEFRMVAPW